MTPLKWRKFSLAEQLGNIGSEATKAFFWKNKDKARAQKLTQTALELFDSTINDPRWRFQLKEVLKLREVFCDCFFGLGNFQVSQESIKKYFIPFALMANRQNYLKKGLKD